MAEVDVLVVGGGVVGLAAAAEIAAFSSVCLLERHRRAGQETSTHNSGVIHAGIYHPPGSLKTKLAIEGRVLLYEFCARYNVPHVRCGKLIVATGPDDMPALEALHRRGLANGVESLEMVDSAFIERREPAVRGAAAIWSPDTGIVEAEAFVRALTRLCTERGVMMLPSTPALAGAICDGRLEVTTPSETIRARAAVNAAGLHADEMSRAFGGQPITIYPCRGDYAELVASRRAMVNGTVYPLPHPSGHGLGVHLTKTTWGSVLVGPTIHYQESKTDCESDRETLEAFHESARLLLPDLKLEDLRPGGSGIRAKLHPPAETFADFLIARDTHVPQLIQAAGIDSPGLTASLAIGRMVARILRE
jgi:L-2-hydroxyglutarate oxidase LhgO